MVVLQPLIVHILLLQTQSRIILVDEFSSVGDAVLRAYLTKHDHRVGQLRRRFIRSMGRTEVSTKDHFLRQNRDLSTMMGVFRGLFSYVDRRGVELTADALLRDLEIIGIWV